MQGVLDWTADNWLTLATFAVATIVAVYLYHRQKQPKTLDYAATSQLIGTGGSAHSRLQVRWEDILPWEHSQNLNAKRSHILESPRIVKIHIRNTGKRAIDESDFKEPITVEVESGWIVDLAVTVSSRKNMFSLEADRNAIYSEKKWTLTPRLLNSGDWIDLRIITEKSPDLPKVTSWIKDQSREMRLRPELLNTPLRKVIASKLRSIEWLPWATVFGAIATVAYLLASATMRP